MGLLDLLFVGAIGFGFAKGAAQKREAKAQIEKVYDSWIDNFPIQFKAFYFMALKEHYLSLRMELPYNSIIKKNSLNKEDELELLLGCSIIYLFIKEMTDVLQERGQTYDNLCYFRELTLELFNIDNMTYSIISKYIEPERVKFNKFITELW